MPKIDQDVIVILFYCILVITYIHRLKNASSVGNDRACIGLIFRGCGQLRLTISTFVLL